VHQTPERALRSRWTLALLQQECAALCALTTLSGVWRRLRKWRLRWKKGRLHVSSPDPDYAQKLEAIAQAIEAAHRSPEKVSVLYSDETTCYRHPFLGNAYQEQGPAGAHQPTAAQTPGSNTKRRIVGTLDVLTGRVLYRANSKIGVHQLVAFLKQVRKAYGPDRCLVLIWDNWPIHFYDKVLAEAEAQRIELLNLPTYAPWTNPIEKLWRKLKQEVLCLHRLSGQWEKLREDMDTFLKSYDRDAPDLLRYVGLAKALEN
jgi:transposase